MSSDRITCPRCPAFDHNERRCTMGKANPPTKLASVELADQFGVRALCVHNPHRETLLRQRFWPGLTRRIKLPVQRRLPAKVTVEVMEDW